VSEQVDGGPTGLGGEARDALLKAIAAAAPTLGNSPSGLRDLAEAYALVQGWLEPNAGVVRSHT